ncbi:MAG: hypothetical protein A2383_02000 [Candidatus Pacebacteria bacterium RIFOXYB1_FULL_39_46]|nr:MAG: hypothetical protein A2182_03515 [Candidatus Pacebacteria bacterium RIFOXYA1_FULL_38_18]OGJ37941.1 MAG: hypothetical protein A2383_02000 [Candidatus Pacebacteria bacterium RIFOXYB1_FULL_39_46]OGJ39539.1 MAG: hypothetical protein A2411_02155 [Candidatus Pacebacteria bacterium RIFOXYC1_FULL_39_21]OGJ40120.1 MAG: hypothetical protein A2582_03445 [Candidatus Pacebacteria bacterium RIFOXYD1_FULL_39_27]
MPRNPDYQKFLDIHVDGQPDGLPQNQESVATPEEIGWRKQYQMRRAIGKARRGVATREDLIYLAKHGLYYPDTPRSLRKKTNKK